jgi:hypothetical protein
MAASDISLPRVIANNAAQISAVAAGVVMAVGGWSGLFWLVSNALPTVPNRWIFYALLHIAFAGTSLPFIRLLHHRFAHDHGLTLGAGVIVRQAIWVGLFGTMCAWLRIPRLLSLPLAIVLIVAIVIMESLLRLRERMQWRPD